MQVLRNYLNTAAFMCKLRGGVKEPYNKTAQNEVHYDHTFFRRLYLMNMVNRHIVY